MKVIKLDRRYAGFPKWKYACQFPHKNHNFRKEYFAYKRVFQELYGPDATLKPDYNPAHWGDNAKWIFNDNWHCDFTRQRILFNNQALISMVMLKVTD